MTWCGPGSCCCFLFALFHSPRASSPLPHPSPSLNLPQLCHERAKQRPKVVIRTSEYPLYVVWSFPFGVLSSSNGRVPACCFLLGWIATRHTFCHGHSSYYLTKPLPCPVNLVVVLIWSLRWSLPVVAREVITSRLSIFSHNQMMC